VSAARAAGIGAWLQHTLCAPKVHHLSHCIENAPSCGNVFKPTGATRHSASDLACGDAHTACPEVNAPPAFDCCIAQRSPWPCIHSSLTEEQFMNKISFTRNMVAAWVSAAAALAGAQSGGGSGTTSAGGSGMGSSGTGTTNSTGTGSGSSRIGTGTNNSTGSTT